MTEQINPYRYYPPHTPTQYGKQFSDGHLWLLWKAGRDSYDIALQTGVPESEVVSRLWRYREARKA
jgi:hypothetical protein